MADFKSAELAPTVHLHEVWTRKRARLHPFGLDKVPSATRSPGCLGVWMEHQLNS